MRLLAPFVLILCVTLLTACGTNMPMQAGTTSAPSAGTATVASPKAAAAATVTGTVSAAQSPDSAGSNTLTVFAAASLTETFTEIGKSFDAANNTTTTFNFAGSQQLAQQIGQGAPADVFASANNAQMEQAIKSGRVLSGTPRFFVRNRLVVIYPKDNPAQLTQLEDLAKPGVKLVLAAKEVPVGQYSLDFLRKASELPRFTPAYSETVLANVASYEANVRAVLSKVTLGEADAGIVYTSDISQAAAEQVGRIDIPDPLNTVAAYPIAPINGSSQAALAQKFVEYVLSPEAQQVLVKYGFIAMSGN